MNSKPYKSNLIISVVLIVLFSIIAVVWLYSNSPGKEAEINVELIKIIVQGVVISILGIWLKYLFEESVKRQEETKAEISAARAREAERKSILLKVFAFLKNLCIRILDGIDGGAFTSATAAIGIEIWDDPRVTFNYLALLDNWQELEPSGLCEDARQSYLLLEEELIQSGNSFSDENKLIIQDKVREWKRYYESRYKLLTLGDDASALSLDKSTKTFQKT